MECKQKAAWQSSLHKNSARTSMKSEGFHQQVLPVDGISVIEEPQSEGRDSLRRMSAAGSRKKDNCVDLF
jgi:hypothetical protein